MNITINNNQSASPKDKKKIGYIFFILGLIFSVVPAFVIKRNLNIKNNGIKTTGVVIENILVTDDDGGSTYKPKIKYTTNEGKEIEFLSSSSTYPPLYEEGDTLELYYLTEKPYSPLIDNFTDIWLLPIIFASFSITFVPIGFFLIRQKEKLTTPSSKP